MRNHYFGGRAKPNRPIRGSAMLFVSITPWGRPWVDSTRGPLAYVLLKVSKTCEANAKSVAEKTYRNRFQWAVTPALLITIDLSSQ